MVKARTDRNVSRLSHDTKPATSTGNQEEEEFGNCYFSYICYLRDSYKLHYISVILQSSSLR